MPLFTSFVAWAQAHGFPARTQCLAPGQGGVVVSVSFIPRTDAESQDDDQWCGYSIWLLAEQQGVCHTQYFGQGGPDEMTCRRRGLESINEDKINQCLVEMTHRALDLQELVA